MTPKPPICMLGLLSARCAAVSGLLAALRYEVGTPDRMSVVLSLCDGCPAGTRQAVRARPRRCYSEVIKSVMPCRYRPGSAGAAKALLAMRDGWSALRSFSRLERGAMAVVGASLLPYSPMHRPAGKLLDDQSEARPCLVLCPSAQQQPDAHSAQAACWLARFGEAESPWWCGARTARVAHAGCILGGWLPAGVA